MSKKTLNLFRQANISIIFLSTLICLFYTIVYFTKHNYLMMVLSALVIFLPLLVYSLDKIVKKGVPDIIKTSFIIFIFVSAVLGGVANFYGNIPFYDKVVHFISGLLISWAFIIAFERFNKNYNITSLIFNLTCFNATVAVLWEFCEFTFDTIFHQSVQRGNTDTMTDMLVAIIGGALVSIIYINKKMRRWFFGKGSIY